MTDLHQLLRQGTRLLREKKYPEAEALYRKLLERHPDQPDGLHLLGLTLDHQGRAEEGVPLIEKAISLVPDHSSYHHNLAGIYRKLGKLEAAEFRYSEAIRLDPLHAEAYQGLAEMRTFEIGDGFEGDILEQLKSSGLSASRKSYYEFALSKYYDDIGEYKRAFEYCVKANRHAARNFDSDAFTVQTKDQLYLYSSDYLESVNDCGLESKLPVFVVGMPRSGTTLVEQILASHSKVLGAGELNDIKQIVSMGFERSAVKEKWPGFLRGLRKEDLNELAREYLARLQKLNQGQFARVVDKHPLNFQFIGLIFTLFPEAKIVHTLRHPLDTCLSCFFQNFSNGQDYSFDIESLGRFYNDYKRLMAHWEQCFPGRIFTIEYEKLLSSDESEIKKLLTYCDLGFEEACLKFYETEREIKTASFLQVRKPLYRSSENRWRHYAPWLGGLARIIGFPLDMPVTLTRPVTVFRSRTD